ncbi:hypothetical protein AVEN_60701-1 [Araneus ventricosus]|uniref:Uncharacterized protein n=1 Tax=Araneus ventricosus TaxID=182803 RepID=A0A4Y2W3Z3_ARAVE|nr:hypothetical protein AVEN_60701-1 [Araneus ventricosus]
MSWVWRFIGYGTLSANPRRHDEATQGSDILTVQRGIQRGRQRPSSSTPVLDMDSGALDLGQTSEYRSWTSASEKPQLRFTSTFHLTHSKSRYGQGLRQAETPPKAKLPIFEVVNKSPRKIFKGWQTRKSLSSLIPEPSGLAMPERRLLQLFTASSFL